MGRCPGSIPAHAGEPRRSRQGSPPLRVYPRACGGTHTGQPLPCKCAGLSPRMRGNRSSMPQSSTWIGSIPAHAGEPKCGSCYDGIGRVYPRACGGTGVVISPRFQARGLSPRMRGNHALRTVDGRFHGSIPAHAGEPPASFSQAARPRVYPRACGGTPRIHASVGRRKGLSPRMRGNRPSAFPASSRAGSIPAHAGEPIQVAQGCIAGRVYPRACGGTVFTLGVARSVEGLSPRMRGNLYVLTR